MERVRTLMNSSVRCSFSNTETELRERKYKTTHQMQKIDTTAIITDEATNLLKFELKAEGFRG